REWAKGIDLRIVEPIEIDGMDAATGAARLKTREGLVDLRPVAIRYDDQTVYRFLFITPPDRTDDLSLALREATYSFRRLTAEEAAGIEPRRVEVGTVRPGDTVEGLARQMPFTDRAEERFRVLNGLSDGDSVTPGQKVKVIRG